MDRNRRPTADGWRSHLNACETHTRRLSLLGPDTEEMVAPMTEGIAARGGPLAI